MATASEHLDGNRMGAKTESLGHKFPAFPYDPYSIQIDFMKALYESLNRGGVAMLGSPTGTGKTLSIICSALQWLVDRRKQLISSNKEVCCSDDEPDWMRNFSLYKNNQHPTDKKLSNKYGYRSKKSERNCRDLCGGKSGNEVDFIKRKNESSTRRDPSDSDDEEYLMEEYTSEDDGVTDGGKSKRKMNGVSLDSSTDDEEEDGSDAEIYFCSRTHSQLSQFINELKKTVFGSELNVVTLGSRKNFCINEDVIKLGSPLRINERCLELQKNKKRAISKIKNLSAGGRVRRSKASSGCPMLSNRQLLKEFRSEISQRDALDIEDIVDVGRQLGTCPYYGSRSMVPAADLVILPYQSILSKSSRESLGLNLKNNIIIIDEAHNLADCFISLCDVNVTLFQMQLL